MSEEWSPAAPELGKDFHEADHGRADEARRSHSTNLVTFGQLEHLEGERSAPAGELHLRPSGLISEVHNPLDAERESKITHVTSRLHSATQELRRDFERGRKFDRPNRLDETERGQGSEH